MCWTWKKARHGQYKVRFHSISIIVNNSWLTGMWRVPFFPPPFYPCSRLASLGNMPFLSPFLKFLAWAQPGAAVLVSDCKRGGGISLKVLLVSVVPAEGIQKSPDSCRGIGKKWAAPTMASVYVRKNKWTLVIHLNELNTTSKSLLLPHSHRGHSCPQKFSAILVWFLWIIPHVIHCFALLKLYF